LTKETLHQPVFRDFSFQCRTGDTQNLAGIAVVPTRVSENSGDMLSFDLIEPAEAHRLRAAFVFDRAGSGVFRIHWYRKQVRGYGVGSREDGRTGQDIVSVHGDTGCHRNLVYCKRLG
jgi:hypothetical protein